MFKKSMVATTALVVAMTIPSIVYGAEQKKPADANKTTVTKTTATKPTTKPTAKPTQPAKPTATVKPTTPAAPVTPGNLKITQEENLKKFKSAPNSTVVGIVGDKKITKGELMDIMWDWASPQLLDEYMNYLVVVQAVQKEGLKITDADIQNKFKEARVPPGDTLESYMQRIKQPKARVTAAYTIPLGLQKITEKNSTVTDAEYSEYVHAKYILIRSTPSTPTSGETDNNKLKQEAKAKAEKCLAEIKAGKSFDEAAKEYSDDTMTKETGGDLGWFRQGEMFPEVSKAAFEMKPGEVSEPIENYFGYYIVKLEKLGKDANAEEKATLKQRIMRQKLDRGMQKLFIDLKEKTRFENLISPALPENKPPTGMAPGGPSLNQSQNNGSQGQPNFRRQPGQPAPR